MYLAAKINQRIVKYDDRFRFMVGRKVSYQYVARLVRDVIRPFGARVILSSDPKNEKDFIEVSGHFEWNKPRHRRIVINIHKHPSQDSVEYTLKQVNLFRNAVSEILQHELVHQEQDSQRRRTYVDRDNRDHIPYSPGKKISRARQQEISYLTEVDEIDAYGHDVAYEVKNRYRTLNPRAVLRTATRRRYLYSLRQYMKAFHGLEWSFVRRKLLARAYKWLPEIAIVPDLLP